MLRKMLSILFCLVLALTPALSLASSHTCYTGPGEKYDYLDFSVPENFSVTLHYQAYDDQGKAWVQAEVKQGENLLRVYLPQSSISGSLSGLTLEQRPEELTPSMLAMVYQTATAVPRLGPGTQYNQLNFPITSQTEGVIILFENGWGLLEVEQDGRLLRMWLPEHDLQY